jgi:hypothetical protein
MVVSVDKDQIKSDLNETSEKISDVSRTYAISLVAFFWGSILNKEVILFNKNWLLSTTTLAVFALALDLLQYVVRYIHARWTFHISEKTKTRVAYETFWRNIVETLFWIKILVLSISAICLIVSCLSYFKTYITTQSWIIFSV